MPSVFFVVGPTAIGKSTLAASLAEECSGEIVNADAFQLYRGLDILTGKPETELLRRVRHHLIGTVDLSEEMSAARYRQLALSALADIRARGKFAIVVGGSGFYVRALLAPAIDAPPPAPQLRRELQKLSLAQAVQRLRNIDPERAARTDLKNSRRVTRAIEFATSDVWGKADGSRGENLFAQRDSSSLLLCSAGGEKPGVFVSRDRDDLYRRINDRVNAMFRDRVQEEVRAVSEIGATAARAIGFGQIQQLLAGQITEPDCIASIQQATRRYAKRQLTWFRHQTTFTELNLTTLGHQQAVDAISRIVRSAPE